MTADALSVSAQMGGGGSLEQMELLQSVTSNVTKCEPSMSDIDVALALFDAHKPVNTKVVIEETHSRILNRYVIRMQYTSLRSGRVMCVVAKGDELPTAEGNLLQFYLRQLILDPVEVGKEFSRLYFLERRARQESFLRDGKTGMGARGSLVSEKAARRDRMKASEYNPAAQLDEKLNK